MVTIMVWGTRRNKEINPQNLNLNLNIGMTA